MQSQQPAQSGGLFGALQNLVGGGNSQQAGISSQQNSQPTRGLFGGSFGDTMRNLAPAIAMIDPRNQQLGMALLAANQGRQKQAAAQQQANQTVKYLQGQGLSADEAQMMVSNPDMLKSWFGERQKAGKPDWKFQSLRDEQGNERSAIVDMNNPSSFRYVGGAAPHKPNLINGGDGQLYNADNGTWISAPNAGQSKIEQDITARKAAASGQGMKPEDPAYQSYVLTGKMPREDQAPLTATDKKAILEADEGVAGAENSITALRSIITPGEDGKSLNDKAGYGWGAGAQSFIARNDPTGLFDDEKGQATTDLDNIVQTNALQSLKSIFGGNPTEGERAILLDIQGSSSKSPEERKNIFERTITMAERRLAFNRQRAGELRGGTFYKQGGGQQPTGPVKIGGYSIEEVQ
ncbi:hypothetical protein N7376_17385 [Brucella intermedia GD04153]|uniref:Uncharacterized protein n=1 Tax=Brucella intermedia GD04153 TaxID=2975438 RepID=A0AA42GZA9_9HYPH|nr:hypothetical protein [Brucella intermedia]MDH0125778.1 hypothetical protein [Brucella intermedia GD04153]